MIDLASAANHREVDAEVMAKFDCHSRWQQSLTQLQQDFDTNLHLEKEELSARFASELNEFKLSLQNQHDHAKSLVESDSCVSRSSKRPTPYPKPHSMTLRPCKAKTKSTLSNAYDPSSDSEAMATNSDTDTPRSDPT